MVLTKKSKLGLTLKVLIFILLGFLLYQQLFLKAEFSESIEVFRQSWSNGNQSYWLALILLMIVNWTLESLKWKYVLIPIQKISFYRALEGILFGITFSLFTPNRMGEFGGRVFALKKRRLDAIVATLIGSLSQIVVNVSIGGVAMLIYIAYLVDFQATTEYVASLIIVVLIFLVALVYFNLNWLSAIIRRFNFLKRYEDYTQIPKHYRRRDLVVLLSFSAMRYLVYCIQFYLMLRLFGIYISPVLGLLLVATIYFVQTILPTYALLEIGVRGNVAVFILKSFTANVLGIFTATMSLWLVNLVVPGIIGACLALTVKFFNTESKS